MAADHNSLPLPDGRPDSGFVVRTITIEPRRLRAYEESEWSDSMVMIEHGQVTIEYVDGSTYCFDRGAILWLVGLPVRCLRNRGNLPAVLVAVSRRQ